MFRFEGSALVSFLTTSLHPFKEMQRLDSMCSVQVNRPYAWQCSGTRGTTCQKLRLSCDAHTMVADFGWLHTPARQVCLELQFWFNLGLRWKVIRICWQSYMDWCFFWLRIWSFPRRVPSYCQKHTASAWWLCLLVEYVLMSWTVQEGHLVNCTTKILHCYSGRWTTSEALDESKTICKIPQVDIGHVFTFSPVIRMADKTWYPFKMIYIFSASSKAFQCEPVVEIWNVDDLQSCLSPHGSSLHIV